MPAAARVGDKHVCSKTEPVAHIGGGIVEPASPNVFIGKRNAARAGDLAFCSGGAHDVIATGEETVLISGRAAARLGDATDGGHIVTGAVTVLIGPNPRAAILEEASREGLPFCSTDTRAQFDSGEE